MIILFCVYVNIAYAEWARRGGMPKFWYLFNTVAAIWGLLGYAWQRGWI